MIKSCKRLFLLTQSKTLQQVFPEYSNLKPSSFKIKQQGEGCTNKLFTIVVDDGSAKKFINYRINGDGTENIINREAENKILQELSAVGQAPRTYANFTNGTIYEYFDGQVLTAEDLPKFSKQIAQAFSRFHQSKLASVSSDPQYFITLQDWYRQVTKFKTFQGFDIFELCKEIDWLKDKTRGFMVGFCHNDLQSRNIIWNEKTKSIRFIDFEYACYNYIAFDIGNHFCEYQDLHLDTSKFPTIDKQMEFISAYTGGKNLHRVFTEAQIGILLSNFFWGIWSIYQLHHSDIEYDFGSYGKRRLELYFEGKRGVEDFPEASQKINSKM